MLTRSILSFTHRSMATMRGAAVAVFGGPENIQVKDDLPVPTISQPNEVLIEVYTAGINPVDTYIRSGNYAVLPSLPYIPGRDGCGVVKEIGTGVKHVNIGDRVWFLATKSGATAEITVSSKVFPLPQALTWLEGACLGVPYLTAHRALFTKGLLKESDRVLIHGASGGVGLAACQLARHSGAALVVGTAGSIEGKTAVDRNGAHKSVCHAESDYMKQLKEIAPNGFDLIIEMAAHLNLSSDLNLLSPGGRIGIVGSRGDISISPRALMQKESSMYGVTLAGATMDEMYECSSMMLDMFTSTPYRPQWRQVYGIEELHKGHSDIIDPNMTALGKRIAILRDFDYQKQ
ncbi:hypothetical protein PFISCL1PPCAC_20209 [Pristionchus fissidentatus]|uniref:Enoyl reductase (ER) domain-containing protein n=1 Tax=Pristionchus fissidentatus TaxID=1538716 RepID=A0AAV5WAQ7_9BILA|nr:hypothetical protein PFISCL1PPCAC_20209 [Pristionchus fissidentatus]